MWLDERRRFLISQIPLVIVGAAFWFQSRIDPLTTQALLIDRSLQVVTLISAALIIATVLIRGEGARTAAFGTGVLGLVFASTVAMTGLIQGSSTRWVTSLAGIAALVNAVWAYRYGKGRLSSGITSATVFATAAALLVPMLQFWNGSGQLASRTEAAIDIDVSVVTVERVDDIIRSRLELTTANDTDARVQYLISVMTICWWQPDESVISEFEQLRNLPNCQVERPIRKLAWIPPKSDLEWSVAITTPVSAPRLTVTTRIAYTQGTRLSVSVSPVSHDTLGDCQQVEVFRLHEESRLRALTQSPKFLVFADFDGDGGTNYFFERGEVSGCPVDTLEKYRRELMEYFGTTELTQRYATWLPTQLAPDDTTEE